MSSITIGSTATDRSLSSAATYTTISLNGTATASGILDTFEIWHDTSATGVKIGTFYGTGNDWTNRDYESIGNVTAGSKQTFTGKSCAVAIGDNLGHYAATGAIDKDDDGGAGYEWKAGDQFGAGLQTYGALANSIFSLYATGTAAEAEVTTQTPTNIVWCGALGNGNIINIGGSALTAKGFCYKVGTSGDPTISDSKVSTTGSSTGAYTVTIGPLEASTSYRVRAYATNDEGTFYGDTVQIATPAQGTQGGGAGGGIFSF